MKQITILLSSVLTLLLITSNNASYASLNFEEIKVTYKPSTGNVGRFNPKRNRLGDDISGYGYRNILKKGNVFKGNVRLLPNRNSGGRFDPISKYSISDEPVIIPKPNRGKFNPTSKYSISDEPAFVPKPAKMHDSIHCVNSSNCLDKSTPKFGGQEGEAFSLEINCVDGECKDKDHIYIGENGKVGIFVQDVGPEGKDGFIVQAGKDRFIGETGKAGFIGQAGIIDGTSNTASPKGVPLKFINGIWTEDLPYD